MNTLTEQEMYHRYTHLLFALQVEIFAQTNELRQIAVIKDAARFISQDEASQQQRQQIESLLLVLNSFSISICKGKALSVLADVVSGLKE